MTTSQKFLPVFTLLALVTALHPSAAERVQVIPAPGNGQVPDAEVDRDGAIHLAYVSRNDAWYVKSTDAGKTFTAPIRINSEPGTVHPPNMYRGPDIAVGKKGRVHVIWYISAYQRKLPKDQWGVFYSYLDPGKTEFAPSQNLNHKPSDNYSLAADEKGNAFAEMMFTLGSIWRAVGDQRRAELAFAASGKQADQEQAVAAPAAPVIEKGKDLKSDLRRAVATKDWDGARRIIKLIPADESRAILEKAGAYELLMERYVETSDFQNVARLYERARQFDQAALAWERAGKLGNARKAYERANDAEGAQRIRRLEVEELVKRGDRLGAAVLLLGENRREEAARVLLELPPAKAFRFLQNVKLDDEAMALARREIQQAESENKPSVKARWLEWTGDALAAAEAWEKAERKDKALEMYEQVGQWQKAAQLAEALGRKDHALELYHRAGDRDSAARLEVLTATHAEEPPPTSAE